MLVDRYQSKIIVIEFRTATKVVLLETPQKGDDWRRLWATR